MSVVQRPLLDNPFRPAPTEDPVYPSCYAAPVSLGAGYSSNSPRSTTTNNANTQPEQPADIAAEIAKKNQLYAAARASNSPQDWQAFKRQRCHIGKLLRESRKKGNSNAKGKRAAFKTDFHCDACEIGFADGAELSAHLSEHVVCDREGCVFQACPQLVSLHVKLQHDTEFIRRCGAVTEEDATEWRRQRRLRYPTLRNIEAKKAVEVELQARREMLGHGPEKRFPARRPKRKRQPRKSQRQRAEAQSNNNSVVTSTPIAETTPVVEPAPRALSPFRGVGTPETRAKTEPVEEEEQHLRITDSESDSEVRPVEVAAPTVGGALGSLMACYGSDSDADDDEPATKRPVVAETPVVAATPLPTTALCDPVQSSSLATPVAAPASTLGGDAAGAGTSPAVPSEVRTNVPARASSNPAPARQRRGKQTGPAPVPARRLTLLQKLLASEMRHERNIVLQCVHHVVQNNFFLGQVPAKPVLESQELAQELAEQVLPLEQSPETTLEWHTSQTTKLSQEPTSDCSEPASKQSTDRTTTLSPELTLECSEQTLDLTAKPALKPPEPTSEQPADETMKLSPELTSKCSLQTPERIAEQPQELASEQSADETVKLSPELTLKCSDQTADLAEKQPQELASEQSADEIMKLSPELTSKCSQPAPELAAKQPQELASEQPADETMKLSSELTSKCSQQTPEQIAEQPQKLASEQSADETMKLSLELTPKCSQLTPELAAKQPQELASEQSADATMKLCPEPTSNCSQTAPEPAAKQPQELASEQSADETMKLSPELTANQPQELASQQSADETMKLSPALTSKCADPTGDLAAKHLQELDSEQSASADETLKTSVEPISKCSGQTSDLATKQLPEQSSEQSTEETTTLSVEPSSIHSEITSDPATKQLPQLVLEQSTILCPEPIFEQHPEPSSNIPSQH